MPRARTSALFILTAGIAISCATGTASANEQALTSYGLVKNIVEDSMVVSPDGTRLAVVQKSQFSSARRVLVDGEHVGGVYSQVAKTMPIFSWDSKRSAFVAVNRDNTQCFVVIDDVVSEPYALDSGVPGVLPVGALVFSPDSRHVAYQVYTKEGTRVVVNDKTYGPYSDKELPNGTISRGVWEFMFSPDSASFAYRARKGQKMVACVGRVADASNKELLTVGPFDAVGRSTPVWSASVRVNRKGRIPASFAFIAREGDREKLITVPKLGKDLPSYDAIVRDSVVSSGPGAFAFVARKDGKSVGVVNGKESKPYDDTSILLTRNGRIAYAAAVGKEVCMVIDGEESDHFDGIRYPGTVFGPQGKRVAYAVTTQGKSAVCLDGTLGKTYAEVEFKSLTFSPDGSRFAYAARTAGKAHVVIDGTESPLFDEVSGLMFSGDSRAFAYKGTIGLEHWLVVDGKKFGPYYDVLAHTVTFSPDSKQYAAAVVSKGDVHVLSDGELGPPCDRVMSRLAFGRTGNHLAYVVRIIDSARRRYVMVYDRRMGQSFDAIWLPGGGKLGMDDTGAVRFIGIKNKEIQLWSAGPET